MNGPRKRKKDSITVRLDEGKQFLLVEERKDLFYFVFYNHISWGLGGVICIERWLQEKETLRRIG